MGGKLQEINTLERFPSSSQLETTDKHYGQVMHVPKQSNMIVEEHQFSDEKSIKTRFSSVGRG